MSWINFNPHSTPVPEIGEHHKISVECGQMDHVTCATTNMIIGLALSGLTGVKASIPIFIVAVGSRLSDSFPLHLAPESEWLQTWPCIFCLGILLILELISDLIPAIDNIVDALMMFLKPIFGTIIAIAPYYGHPGFGLVLLRVVGASGGALLGALMALVKALNTLAISAATAGCGSPIRSLAEDVVTTGSVAVTLIIGVLAAATILFLCLSFIVFWAVYRKSRGKSLLPSWCPCRRMARRMAANKPLIAIGDASPLSDDSSDVSSDVSSNDLGSDVDEGEERPANP